MGRGGNCAKTVNTHVQANSTWKEFLAEAGTSKLADCHELPWLPFFTQVAALAPPLRILTVSFPMVPPYM